MSTVDISVSQLPTLRDRIQFLKDMGYDTKEKRRRVLEDRLTTQIKYEVPVEYALEYPSLAKLYQRDWSVHPEILRLSALGTATYLGITQPHMLGVSMQIFGLYVMEKIMHNVE